MMLLGSHVSIAGGLHKAFGVAQEIGCTAIQIFTKNANRWQAKPLQPKQIERFLIEWKASGIASVVVHDSYLINLGTPKDDLLHKSREALLIELQRCQALQIPYLVMHPGAHVGSGEEAGLKRVAASFDYVHEQTPGYATQILVETTAGQGTNLGYCFEHLATILDLVKQPERLGICFDTCHAFAAGYELRTEAGYHEAFERFDKILGLERLKAIHLNDSLKGLGSRVDRHQGIGQGILGLEPFRFIMNDPRLTSIPKILETPKGDDPVQADRENLRILRSLLATPKS
ncbi:deoxyribonuclease IV [candidate division KSB3 bacterium]|uniref:Probable endonuclease 4 n=1 Tax=candidate division KSB3 bacterium TaxID=2044937 RepID=A0A9D5Q888_9BACT|nr:deoxyribonuclease IV [candidate division KSB3 bacterium]MBD3327072.1 deoxyribonuclease IV [candidate division KSB3 bacterium]